MLDKKILRVFPRKTNATPTDEMVRIGPPTVFDFGLEIDEIHISVTFTYDLEYAEDLYFLWQVLGVPVEVGGPAFDDRMGDFTPGLYLKDGYTFTSRGCTKDCWFCSVPRCAHGVIRELPITPGWNIMDDNILGTSETHFREVISMLKKQEHRPVFSGGLEPGMLQQWQSDLILSVKPQTIYTAYDTRDDYEALREMRKKLDLSGFDPRSRMVKCYALCGYDGDTFAEAETRMQQIMQLGFLPFAMAFRDDNGIANPEWKKFQREWANPFIVGAKFSEILNKGVCL